MMSIRQIGFGAAVLAGAAAGCMGADATTAPTGDGVVAFPTYGLSVTAPPASSGWVADICPRVGIIGSWTRFDAKTHEVMAQIAIADKGKFPFGEGKQLEYAAHYRARLLDQKFEIDHVPATAIRKEKGDERSGPFLLLVTKAGERTYEFDGIGYQEDAPAHDLVGLVKSAHWIPMEDSLDHLGGMHAVEVFDGLGTVQLPEVFRDASGGDTSKRNVFSVIGEKGQAAAVIELKFFPAKGGSGDRPNDAELARFKRTLLQVAQSEFNMQGGFVIDDGHLMTNGVTTNLGKIPSMTKENVVESYDRMAMVFLATGGVQSVMANFSANEDAARRWDKVLLDVTNSVSFYPVADTQPAGTQGAATQGASTQAASTQGASTRAGDLGVTRFKLNVP